MITGLVGERVRELLRGICQENEVEMLKGQVSKDHVHLLVTVPAHLAISKLVQYLKGKSSDKLLAENKQLAKAFWGRPRWARGYFVATSGNITDEAIMDYIQNQDENQRTDEFTVVE